MSDVTPQLEVRTRFAPSPTGNPHVGNLRTAIYAWLLARHFNGKFLLRIEDTDQERKVPGAMRFIVQELNWLGILPDEGPSEAEFKKAGESWTDLPYFGGDAGPYIQSLRLPRYKEVAELLVAKGAAYRCDCTPQMLEQERKEQMARKELPGYSGYCRTRNVDPNTKHVIRFKMPFKPTVVLMDAVRGRVAWEGAPIRDTVLLKSDGFPTYHLAVVVDDHDMRISHVLRGEEWLSSTPIHLLLYDALGWKPPIFAHPPLILGADSKKLSKRHGATSTDVFRDQGYLSDVIFNFVTLLGWSLGEGDEQEIFTREELIKRFSLEGINKSGAVFDYNKLSWMNGTYIRALPVDDFMKRAKPFLVKAGLSLPDEQFKVIAPHIQERVKTLDEIPPMIEFLCVDKITRDTKAMFTKGIDSSKAAEVLKLSEETLSEISSFDHQTIEGALRPLAERLGLKVGPMFGVLRIAVTGKTVTPPLFESFAALGKEMTLRRIKEARAELV